MPIAIAALRLSLPTSSATFWGTGGNSPAHTGASPVSFTGATTSSSCSGSASMISQVRPAITNLRARPIEFSSPLPSERTKASSTEPSTLRVTTSRTR